MAVLGATLAVPMLAAADDAPRTASRDEPRALAVFVHETPDAVRLRVQLPSGGDPGAVEVQLDERTVTVLARDAAGAPVRSHPLTLHAPAVESGATADYDDDGWITVTLRRKPLAR